MKQKTFLILPFCFFLLCSTLHAETINISAAASMTDAIKELITAFKTANSDIEIRPNFASSGSLAKQINQGAPADIYISANPKWMKFLVEEKQIAPTTDVTLAYNTLVFLSIDAETIKSMDEIPALQRIAIGDPKSVPAGRYAEQAMQGAGIYETVKADKKLIFSKDVRQALLYADRGEVNGAFVYKTDALLAKAAKIAFEVPEQLYSKVTYPLGLTLEGADKEDAKNFYTFLQSTQAAEVLKSYGFKPAQ